MPFARRRSAYLAMTLSLALPNIASAQSNTAGPFSDQVEQRLRELRNNPLARTSSEMDTLHAMRARLANCWDVPASVQKRSDMAVSVRVKFGRDGSLAGPPTIINSNPDPLFAHAAKSVTAALQKCAPFNFMPAAKYDAWKEIEITFDPREMFGNKAR